MTRALEKVQETVTHGVLAGQDERATVDLLQSTVEAAEFTGLTCADVVSQLTGLVRSHADTRRQHEAETLGRLSDLAATVAPLPGLKVLLYLSKGLEQRPSIHLYSQIADICPQALYRDSSALFAPMAERDLSPALQETAARCSAARVVIYPLDGRGLLPPAASDPSHGNRRYVPSVTTDKMKELNLRAGEWILAEQTGGVPVFNANDVSEPLRQVAREIEGRYTLGFVPDREPDGKTHRLQVESKAGRVSGSATA